MSYRLARIVHWIQNPSVTYYPTSYLPQLYQKPWSEFTIMHFQILSGSDRFANLAKWFSMVGSIIGVSLIAKQLDADLRGRVFSAKVGLSLEEDSWEYPFWVLLQKQNEIYQIEQVNVENISGKKYQIYPYKNFVPCAIISVKKGDIVNLKANYVKQWSLNSVSVLVRK
jgi:hypothetical protein